MRKLLFYTILAVVSILPLKGEYLLNDNIKSAIYEIYNLRLDSAKSIIVAEQKLNPKNDFISYIKFNIAFTKIFISENEELYSKYEEDLGRWIENIKNTPESEEWRGTCLTEMYMLRSALKLKFGKNIKSGFDGIKAYNNAQDFIESNPNFKPFWLSWGLMNVAVGSVPDSYKGLASALGFDGDIEEGINYIEKAWAFSQEEENTYLSTKSTLIYVYTNLQMGDEKIVSLVDLNLKEDFTKNTLLVYLQARLLQENENNEALINLLENRPRDKDIYPFYYLDFMEGKAKTAALIADADKPFMVYLENYEGKHFIKAVHFRLAAYYALMDNDLKADYHKGLAITEGYDFTGADKMAVFMANRKLNKVLLRAQSNFDNAEYNKAIDQLELNQNYCVNSIDSIEMHYRYGRIYQALGMELKAIVSFKKSVELNSKKNVYYSANSALQLARLMEQKEMNASAKYYYKLALEFRGYPFNNGIQQQAKAGKNRVEKKL